MTNYYNKNCTISLRLTVTQLEMLEKLVELANREKHFNYETKSSVILRLIAKEYENKIPKQK